MPTAANPPSLGSKGPKYMRVREQSPMPPDRELLLTELGRILRLGMVQKILIEVGNPILFERLIRGDGDLTPDIEVVEGKDLYDAARNSELKDFQTPSTNPFEILFLAFKEINNHKLVPKAFLGSNWDTVRKWLKLGDYEDVSIFGVPAYNYPSDNIPEDILMLIASDPVETDDVKLTLRIPMDLPRVLKKKNTECRNAGKVD